MSRTEGHWIWQKSCEYLRMCCKLSVKSRSHFILPHAHTYLTFELL